MKQPQQHDRTPQYATGSWVALPRWPAPWYFSDTSDKGCLCQGSRFVVTHCREEWNRTGINRRHKANSSSGRRELAGGAKGCGREARQPGPPRPGLRVVYSTGRDRATFSMVRFPSWELRSSCNRCRESSTTPAEPDRSACQL